LPAPERFRRLVLEAQTAARLPSVAAAVFRGGELDWAEAVGLADVEQRTDTTTDTQYAIAPITKTFTATCVFQLRDEGKLELEDPLSRHLPEAAHGTPTLRRLLSHASGLQREPPGEIWETLVFPDEEELLRGLEDAEQVLPPGAAWHYSNLAYALLGHVVAHVAGKPFREHLVERLLGPLGLERTTWGRPSPRRCRTSSSRTRMRSGGSRCSSSAARAANRAFTAPSATSRAGDRSCASRTSRS